MTTWPDFNEQRDLPPGIHQATLVAVIAHFGRGSARRQLLAQRLTRIYRLVMETGHLARFIVFGSFVTAKPGPGNIDIFILMENTFDASQVTGEASLIFDHLAAQGYEGASIFWIRRVAAIGGEEAAIAHWQLKRDGTKRGIVEVIADDQE